MRGIPVKITSAALALCVVLSCTACGKNKTESSSPASTSNTVTTNPVKEKVEIKSYEFPEFLNDIDKPDVLTRELFKSFDSDALVKDVEKQPFKKYTCEKCIDNLLYTFKDKGYCGVINKSGKVVVPADKYSSVTPGKKGMLIMSYPEEMHIPDDYFRYNSNGSVAKMKNFEFDENDIKIMPAEIEDNSGKTKTVYEMVISGSEKVKDNNGVIQWDSVEKVQAKDLDTDKDYKAYYRGVKDNAYYYICFDQYYNYTIYSGEYAYVKIKVGNVCGECYILSYDDYSELTKMVTSFGESAYPNSISKDESRDFIQITFGLNTEDTVVMTISPDGYCLTDSVTHNKQPENKYFSCLDKESFVSLIEWADTVLSKEYTK